MQNFLLELHHLLMKPTRVAVICIIFGLTAVVYDGSLYRYWSLQNSEKEMVAKIAKVQVATQVMRSQIEQTREPEFIEKQAREHLDLVGDDEIVFIFSNDGER